METNSRTPNLHLKGIFAYLCRHFICMQSESLLGICTNNLALCWSLYGNIHLMTILSAVWFLTFGRLPWSENFSFSYSRLQMSPGSSLPIHAFELSYYEHVIRQCKEDLCVLHKLNTAIIVSTAAYNLRSANSELN